MKLAGRELRAGKSFSSILVQGKRQAGADRMRDNLF